MTNRLAPAIARASALFDSRWYCALLCAAVLWAAGNAVFVYLGLDGERVYRLESAVILLAVLLLPRALFTSDRPAEHIELPHRAAVALAAFATILWVAIYPPLLGYPFLSDDYVFLELYGRFEGIGQATQFFRPLYAVVFWALTAVSDASPMAFHALGFSLHLCSSYCVYRLSAQLFRANGPAILSGIVFLLNPLQSEAVLWVSGLQDALWVCFVLGALVVYVGQATLSPSRVALSVTLIAAGLLSKETAVSYIVLFPAADWAFFRFRRGKWLPPAYALFIIELVLYLVVRSRFVAFESTYLVEPSRYFAKQLITTPYRFFAQPWNVAAIDVPNLVLCGAAVLVMTAIWWTIVVRRRSGALVAGAFVMLATTLPVYSYFFVREDLFSARYLYGAAAGWGLIVAASASSVTQTRRSFLVCACSAAVVLAISVHLNLRPWRTVQSVIEVLTGAIVAGEPPARRLEQWAKQNNVELIFRDSAPREYKGVGIFINGYDGFLRLMSNEDRDDLQ